MVDFIWTWTKGDTKVFTKDIYSAEKAMKEGNLVMGIKAKPSISIF